MPSKYYDYDEDELPKNLRRVVNVIDAIDQSKWGPADQHERDRMTREALEPLDVMGKLSDDELQYLEDWNYSTTWEYLTQSIYWKRRQGEQ